MLAAIEGDADENWLRASLSELNSLELVTMRQYLGKHFEVQATYRGLVWETRRGFTRDSRFIDDLVAEWETTSVEFKREVHTDTADQKAELVKDIVSLANTQSSGRRWLAIGFDDKTHDYWGPPDTKLTQNHLEQLLAQYTNPCIEVQFSIQEHRLGKVGRLEILRDAKLLPYRVKKSIGDKKRIEENQIFVRHGSQTEEPTPRELLALQEEAGRAGGL